MDYIALKECLIMTKFNNGRGFIGFYMNIELILYPYSEKILSSCAFLISLTLFSNIQNDSQNDF